MIKTTVRLAVSSLFRFKLARNPRWTGSLCLPLLVFSLLSATAQQAHLTVVPAANAVNLGTVNIGSASKPSMLTFTFTSPGSGISVQVLTLGVKSGDYADAGTGSCTTNGTGHQYSANDTCTVNVTLTPTFNGPRNGAVELVGTGGQIVASAYVYGTGYGPQIAYPGGAQATLPPNFNGPSSVAVDGAGNVYASSIGDSAVEEYVAATGVVKTLAIGFSIPGEVAVDGAGNVYVADTYNNAVKEIMAVDGSVVPLGGGYKFVTPNGVAVDGAGNVYVADSGNNLVEEILATDGTVHTLGSGFQNPVGIAVDGAGNVYVASIDDNSAKEIVLATGSVKTLSTTLNLPRDIAVDGIGNVYVTDTYNNVVKVISATDGSVRSVGTGLNVPDGVVVDAGGNIYIADYNNNRVVIENDTTAPTLTFASPTSVDSLDASDGPQSFSIENIGSAPLTLSPSGSANPTLTAGFALASGGTTCASSNGSSSATALLASNTICAYAVNFTPVTSGPIQGKLTLTDNNGVAYGTSTNASQIILLNGTGVGSVSILVTGTLPAATASLNYTGSFSASGGVAPYTFAATGLPTGLTLSKSGSLSGIPTTAGTYAITVTATDANSFTGTANFTLTVAVSTADFQFTLTNATPQTITAGGSAQYNLTVSPVSGSFPFPVSFSVSGLPAGYVEVFSPSTVTPGSNTVSTQLTVQSNTTFTSVRTSNPYGIIAAFLMLPFFGLRRLRRRLGRSVLAVLMLAGGLAATVGLTGCVGNHVNPATYNVTITATGNNFHHSVTTVLAVQ